MEEIPQPLLKIHLHSDALGELEANGDIRYVYIFSVVAIFILLLALVNFINLATARSADRVQGSWTAGKFWVPSENSSFSSSLPNLSLMSLAAVIIGVVIANLLMPFFNSLSGKALFVPNGSIVFWLIIIPVGIVIGILAGTLSGNDHVSFQAHDHPCPEISLPEAGEGLSEVYWWCFSSPFPRF